MMIVCINTVFARIFKKANIEVKSMNKIIQEVIQGNSIPLGHKLFKKRIPSQNQGKRGAYRSILYYRTGDLMVFVYLFAKNDVENISPKELKEMILLSRLFDTMHGQDIHKAILEGKLVRWNYEEQ